MIAPAYVAGAVWSAPREGGSSSPRLYYLYTPLKRWPAIIVMRS